MQSIVYSYPLTQLQKLFVEKVLELSHPKSLDSYRSKVSCPTYMLNEFYSVLDDMKKGKVKYVDSLFSFRDELVSVLEDDSLLNYARMSKVHFINLLISLKDEAVVKSKIDEVEHALYFLIVTNKNYKKSVFQSVKSYIDSGAKPCEKCTKAEMLAGCKGCAVTCLYEIERLSAVLVSELLHYGWSKVYMHKYIKAKFAQTPDFESSWTEFEDEFSSARSKEISIVFKVHSAAYKLSKFTEDDLKANLSAVQVQPYEQLIKSEKLKNWLKPHGNHRFMVIKTEALDYQQAMKKAKTSLSNWLDLMYLGYSDTRLDVDGFALVYSDDKADDANLYPIHHAIDGSFKSDTETYNQLKKKVQLIQTKSFVALEPKDKIETAIRYLRAGSEALELEQKFLNYWIGLENIFSSNIPTERTFNRIVKYFTVAHSVSYTKRNITELHKDIRRVGAWKALGMGRQNDIKYLENIEPYDKLIALSQEFPLLSQRARMLKSVYFGATENKKMHLKKHAKNLERQLVRMYRVRNQLVHEAAIMENIENISGSLRYYLTFILNKMIDFFSDCNEKPMKTNLVTMDDFFFHQELVWANIEESKLDFSKLVHVPHSVEFIS